jgi:hypothetical protein
VKPLRKTDLAAALIFLILGAATVLILIPRGVTVPGTVEVAALSPDFWPRLIAFGCIAASLFLLVEAVTMAPPEEADAEGGEDAEYQLATLPAALRTLVLIAALFAFYFSLTTLGVVAASVVLLGAMMLFFGERHYVLVGAISLGLPLILYFFFRYAASVPIPLGIFGN